MRKISRLRIVTAILLACAFSNVGAANERWATYANPRFGTTADYPAGLFTVLDPPPENGDGQGFRTADGRAKLSIYGAWNVQRDTPQTYVTNYVDMTGASVTYKRVTDRFYVISGKREGNIFYDRCNFSTDPEGIINCFSINYPEHEKAAWERIVSRLSSSLRAEQVTRLGDAGEEPPDLNAEGPENRVCSGTLIVSKGAPDVAFEIRTKAGIGSCFFVRGSPVAERILATCALNETCEVRAVVGRSGSLFAIAEVLEVNREGAGVPPAQSETEPGLRGFMTPSGNIHCLFDAGDEQHQAYLRCDMAETTNPIPPKPSSCDLDWGNAFGITQVDKVGELVCAGDTVLLEPADVLPYGSTWQQQGFTCLSEQSGLTCFNAKRHGFTLSRSSQKLF